MEFDRVRLWYNFAKNMRGKGDLYVINIPFPRFLIREGRQLRVVGVFLGAG
jgi:hypothetical protein